LKEANVIFFFSATGNSRYAANRIARATGDGAISITDSLNSGELSFDIAENEPVGFVIPTYFWGLPTVVVEFLDRMRLNMSGAHYAYHVLTFGTTIGQAHDMFAKLAARRGLAIDGSFCVKMVDTWTPIFDLSDPARNARVTADAEPAIEATIERISARTKGRYSEGTIPRPFAALLYHTYLAGRKTKKFSVTDACTGCGLCEKGCPAHAIAMAGGNPTWIKDRCALCLSCLHHCPSFAIRYGAASAKHGQFVNPNA
jgi:NAD-dependent dihydropyrimidine dehydrogenase PreA subunit/flavodoxin